MTNGRMHKRWMALLGAFTILGATLAAAPLAAQDVVTCLGFEATIIAEEGVPTEGTSGPDVIVGTEGADVISGKGGSDLICGAGGNDLIRGGIGPDILLGDAGRDMIQGGAGGDVLIGGLGADTLQGGDNADQLFGFRGADILDGGKGNDRLKGGGGADTLIGNNGRKDRLDGGRGTDVCNDDQGTTRIRKCESGSAGSLDLTILHINDHHSHLDPGSADLVLGGEETRVSVGGFPSVVAKFDELEAAHAGDNVVKVHAGDAITGTLFYSLFSGEADAALMNEVCFDLFELGNHEFDDGDAGLADFLDFLAAGDCDTTVLAANVVPAADTPLAPTEDRTYFEASKVIDYGGQKVGYVGLDIVGKTQNSSSPLETTQFLDEIETAQANIDELRAAGVNKVVLVTHIQLANDLDLAAAVTGVDVIVGGDSHSLLGDFADRGLNPVDDYPVQTTDAAGNPVCIVQAWQYSAIVGEVNVSWDGNGVITGCEGTPHLLLNDTFQRRLVEDGDRVELEGDARQAVLDDIAATANLSVVTPDADAQAILDGFSGQVDELTQTVIGTVTEDLCLERIPGQGRSQICDVADTATNGGDIQQLVAEAFRSRSFESDIAIQNAGGVRIDIPAGDLTIADAYTLLPFANTIVNLEMTGAELKQVLEEAAAFAIDPDGSTGAYPYAAGLRWDMDLTAADGSRLSNLEVKGPDADAWTPLDLEATYTVATNDFIAGGRDGYLTFGTISDEGRVVDTFLDYAKTFIDYVEDDAAGTIGKLPIDEYSTQNFVGLPDEE